jgi:predicted RNA-binding protein with PUA-like domain
MNYFLAKTDPDTYSFADFIKEGETLWDGVHSHAAINFIKQMQVGDLVYIYESLTTKAIVGLAEVSAEPYLNTADPRFSWAVKLKYVKTYNTPLSLATIKAEPALKDFPLVRIGRLSVMPVEPSFLAIIQKLFS